MRNQQSKTPAPSRTDAAVRPLRRWPLRGVVLGLTALGLAAALAACSGDSASDPLPLGESDSGVVTNGDPVDGGEMEEGDPVDGGEMQEDEMEDEADVTEMEEGG